MAIVSPSKPAAPRKYSAAEKRAIFLRNARPRALPIQPQQNFALGATQITFPLLTQRGSVARYARITYTIPVTITGSVTPSPKMPFNVFTRARFIDGRGSLRVDASPYSLYLLRSMTRRGYDPSNPAPYGQPGGQSINPLFVGLPLYESQRFFIPTAAGAGTIAGSFVIPMAMDQFDPRGAPPLSLWETGGRIELDVQPQFWAQTPPVTPDVPYTGAGGTNVVYAGGAVMSCALYFWTVDQDARLPANEFPGQFPYPLEDMAYVREVKSGNDINSAIAPNQTRSLVLPTARAYYHVIQSIVENGVPALSHVNQMQLQTSEEIQFNEYLQAYLNRIHDEWGREVTDGVVYWDLASHPLSTDRYGDVIVVDSFTQNFNNAGTTYIENLYDTLFYKGV